MGKAALTRPPLDVGQSLYEKDFYSWTQRTAALLRQRHLAEVDVDHAAEEIADMGRRDARELKSRMRVLIRHLLKWQHQPRKRSAPWRATIDEQREAIGDLLEQSPSLRAQIAPILTQCYGQAARRTIVETGLSARALPARCPYSPEQLLDDGFLPG